MSGEQKKDVLEENIFFLLSNMKLKVDCNCESLIHLTFLFVKYNF